MRRFIVGVAVGLLLAACSDGGDSNTATATTATVASATTTTRAATTTTARPTTTEVSERLAHWQDVVKSMQCPELADLEQKRLAIAFNDQAESLIAIHDRQAKLHC
jgi:hypothetical protein